MCVNCGSLVVSSARCICNSGCYYVRVKVKWGTMGGKLYNMTSPVFSDSILRSIGYTLSRARDSTKSLASRFWGFDA
jgi:hypothetical protein